MDTPTELATVVDVDPSTVIGLDPPRELYAVKLGPKVSGDSLVRRHYARTALFPVRRE
jgi:hypothetical protein